MAADDGDKVQSGSQIVATFVGALKNRTDLDAGTVLSIQALHDKGKLSKTSLIRALEEQRSGSTEKSNGGEKST